MNKTTLKIVGGVIAFYGLAGIVAINAENINNATDTSTETAPAAQIQKVEPTITYEEITEVEEIPFETVYYNDSSTYSGQEIITVYGENGEKTNTIKITYSDGKEISRETISSEITKEPVAQQVARGTYVEPAPQTNYYSNVTAICKDGTASYSQHRRGTCSHHGGVQTWVNYPAS